MAATFFAGFGASFQVLQRLVADVRRDHRTFNVNTLLRVRDTFIALGHADLEGMHGSLVKVHYPDNGKGMHAILPALLDRYKTQWSRTVTNAFATAIESVPEHPNQNRARVRPGGPQRTIWARIMAAIRRRVSGTTTFPQADEFPEEAPNAQGGRELYGVMRTRDNYTRGLRLKLIPYLRMLVRQTPRNFAREWRQFVLKTAIPVGENPLYLISAGHGPNSCQTCVVLNGRVLTQGALDFAKTRLKPQLFHPNCVHRVNTGGLRGITETQYDPTRFGPLVDLTELRRMVSRGVLASGPARKAFV